MMVNFNTCDHCGKKLEEIKDYISIDVEIFHCISDVDLCEECLNELEETVKAYVGRSEGK